MKTMKSFLLVAAIAFSSVLSASTNPDSAKTAKAAETTIITDAVEKLLQNPSFEVEQEMTARVTLTINKNNELVVLSVESDDNKLEGFLKGRLNYNELPDGVTKSQKTYVIPVRIVKTEI